MSSTTTVMIPIFMALCFLGIFFYCLLRNKQNRQILFLLPTLLLMPVTQPTWAHAEVETPFQHGYSDGLADGKVSGSDATDSCSQYNSTLDNTQCSRGYDLGFKKGCLLEGDKLPFDPSAENGQCRDYK